MKRNILSPRDAAWLAQTFDRNRAQFAGFSMEADPNADPAPGAGGKPAIPADLGDAGKKAIESEREARKKAEQDLAALRKEFDGFRSSLGEIAGVKPAKGDDGSETLQQVQKALADIQHENTVLALANEHGITDAADLSILRGSSADADGLKALANRLAPSADSGAPGTPKPDKTQGSKGDPPKPDTGPGVARMAAAFDEAMATSTT